jgi:hypothetical protein
LADGAIGEAPRSRFTLGVEVPSCPKRSTGELASGQPKIFGLKLFYLPANFGVGWQTVKWARR